MQLNLQPHNETNIIQSINTEGDSWRIMIGDKPFSSSLILTPQTIEMWNVSGLSELTQAHFDALAALSAEVVLFGSGATLQFPDPALRQSLIAQNIGFEVMDTAAACRTYNILAADGRNVAAALIL